MTSPSSTNSTSTPASKSANKNSGLPFGKEDPRHRQKVLIGSIGGVALIVALALLFIFRPWEHQAPKISGEPVKLSQFISTPDFQNMSFEKREIYMKMMHAKKDQLVQAYSAGQISIEDYQKALLEAHLGKNLDDMRKYFAKPVGADRVKYLDKVIAKGDEKDEVLKRDPAAKEVKKEQSQLKDDAADRAEVATWPQDIQTEYNQYRQVLSERKQLHKAAEEATTTPSTPIPTTVPSASSAGV